MKLTEFTVANQWKNRNDCILICGYYLNESDVNFLCDVLSCLPLSMFDFSVLRDEQIVKRVKERKRLDTADEVAHELYMSNKKLEELM